MAIFTFRLDPKLAGSGSTAEQQQSDHAGFPGKSHCQVRSADTSDFFCCFLGHNIFEIQVHEKNPAAK
ncbi:MAG: hypothetical protein IPG76_13065 [Acidobacteria bacterium]|nr:hypothetical protein [Acidobacteriota bacterium]